MHKGNRPDFRRIGCCVVLAGVFVFLALFLPAGFWWFLLGCALVCAGFFILRAC